MPSLSFLSFELLLLSDHPTTHSCSRKSYRQSDSTGRGKVVHFPHFKYQIARPSPSPASSPPARMHDGIRRSGSHDKAMGMIGQWGNIRTMDGAVSARKGRLRPHPESKSRPQVSAPENDPPVLQELAHAAGLGSRR